MIDLNELKNAVGDLNEEKVTDMLNRFINIKPSSEEAHRVLGACQDGMALVGELFEKNHYFVGDLIFAGELLKDALAVLTPVIGKSRSAKIGTIILGTVCGDLHDIGKNIFKAMAEAAGFEVHDLGIDQPVSAFVEKAREVNPDIIGMSGVLTLALEEMKNTVEGLKKAGINNSKIIIGGNAVTGESCSYIGADAYTTNAAEGVKICKGWVV